MNNKVMNDSTLNKSTLNNSVLNIRTINNPIISRLKTLAGALAFASFSITTIAGDNNDVDTKLKSVINSEHRSEKNAARDDFRNPAETLQFFGIRPEMTVVEIWPGGGWYTEILAPYLKDKGKYIAANFDPDAGVKYYNRRLKEFEDTFVANEDIYGDIVTTVFNPPAKTEVAKAGTADLVLTFRNVHNWYIRGDKESVVESFKGFYKALKPGGILGVVEHRLPKGMSQEENKRSGYMREDLVIEWAKQAGFVLVAESSINANEKDTADHPKGVWTLPPSLRLGDENKDKYMAIGESDRMTLKFAKPAEK
ncbi:class I SAM-dependent methyltransferase [Pleionea mediterranea]|uniref:Putative methyltransferase n=1 Tax=Pleionea mediterranea TaxID=523701 RepID=A0A316FMB3_9GAMM|nr:methyltransferase [Pleionea mediterranea]PWK50038.1 putative methyltransferase [Pleionea mediterranea]